MTRLSSEVLVRLDGFVATVEMCKPPHNFFDLNLLDDLVNAFSSLEADGRCRVIVLAGAGRSFCAGADFSATSADGGTKPPVDPATLYTRALGLFAVTKPVIAAVHGPAVGGGLGLALVADFRVTCVEARFSANFAKLGFHPGFGMSVTLPRLIGLQKSALLFYTGRRINGLEAVEMGLADELVGQGDVRARAQSLAAEIATSAPIAVESIRATLRAGLVEQIRRAMTHEALEQSVHFETEDFREGVAAMTERREPVFARR